VFLGISFIQIALDLYDALYPPALIKIIFSVIFAFVLNAICASGYVTIAWVLVIVPIFCMSIITAIIMFIFGVDLAEGKIQYAMGKKKADKNQQNTNKPSPNSTPSLFSTNFSLFSSISPPSSSSSSSTSSQSSSSPNSYHMFSPYYQFGIAW